MTCPMSTWSVVGLFNSSHELIPAANCRAKAMALSRRSRSRACSETLILRKVERPRTPATMAMTRRVAFVWRLVIGQRCTPCIQRVCKTIPRQKELSNLDGNQHELVSLLGRHSQTRVSYHTPQDIDVAIEARDAEALHLGLTVVGPIELLLGDWRQQLSPPGKWVPPRDSGLYCWYQRLAQGSPLPYCP